MLCRVCCKKLFWFANEKLECSFFIPFFLFRYAHTLKALHNSRSERIQMLIIMMGTSATLARAFELSAVSTELWAMKIELEILLETKVKAKNRGFRLECDRHVKWP